MPWGSRVRRKRRVGLGLVLAGAAIALALGAKPALRHARAQGNVAAEPELIYFKRRSFRIPFQVQEADRPRIKGVQLFASTDHGQSWQLASRAGPEDTTFAFKATRDDEYWFAVRTLDTKGRLFPPDDAEVEPSMKVVVDTTPPELELRPHGRRGEWASIDWQMNDRNLDSKSLVIQYRAEGARDWRQVPVRETGTRGTEEWQAGTASALVVRAWVDDRAGNRTEKEITLSDGIAEQTALRPDEDGFEPPPVAPVGSALMSGRLGTASPSADGGYGPPPLDAERPGDSGFEPAPSLPSSSAPPSSVSRSPQRTETPTQLVANPRFALQYAVEDAGPDGPALVELWVTRDNGQSWTRLPPDPDRVSPYDVDLGAEGTYGLWLVVQSAASLGDPPPRPGDTPQLWVEVDSTPPEVRLDPPRIGTGANFGKVLITWRASDPHFGSRPVLLSYRADRPDAPWTPITERLDNTGRYIWTMPPNVPPRIHLRIDAVDRLGNRGFAETTEGGAILVDLSRPRGRILGLDPRADSGPSARSRR